MLKGLIVLAVGVGILWIPYVSYLGYLVCFSGFMMVYSARLGSRATRSKHMRMVLWLVITSFFLIFLSFLIFYALMNSEMYAIPYPDNAVAREQTFDFEFLLYFYLVEFIELVFIFALVAGVWILARKNQRLLLSIAVLLLSSIMIYTFLTLNSSVVLPYNPPMALGYYLSTGQLSPLENFLLAVLTYPSVAGVYTVFPLAILAFAFISIGLKLKQIERTSMQL